MDGENIMQNPIFLMDELGVPTPILGNTQLIVSMFNMIWTFQTMLPTHPSIFMAR